MFGRVYVKAYRGKTHIVLKGSPGLRKILTGTKYGVNNPKITSMGLGTKGAMNSIKEGGMITVVLVTAFDIFDYFMNYREMLTELFGKIAGDLTKVAVAAGISAASVALLSGTIITSFALGPLLVAVAVGVGAGLALNWIDDYYQLTEKLKAMLAAAASDTQQVLERSEDRVQLAGETLIDRAYDGFCALVGRIVRATNDKAAHYIWSKINNLKWYLLPQAL